MVEIGENALYKMFLSFFLYVICILWKKTSNRFHGIKNHRIWTWFRGEIKIWSGEKISSLKIAILDEILQNWNLNPNLNIN